MTPENSPEKTMEHSKEIHILPGHNLKLLRCLRGHVYKSLGVCDDCYSEDQKELSDLRQQLSAAKPAIDFCAGIHVETLTLLNQANHPTLTQICEENQSLRKQLADIKARTAINAIERLVKNCCSDCGHDTTEDGCAFCLRAELAKNKAAREWINKWSNEIIEHWQLPYPATIELRALIQPKEKK